MKTFLKLAKTATLIWVCLLIMGMTMAFSACSNDDEPEVEPKPIQKVFFEIEKQGFSISSESQTFDVNVHTNISGVKPAILTDNERAWISIAATKQEKENLTYQVSVKENTGSEKREGAIVFQYSTGDLIGGLNTISITQDAPEP